MSAKDFDSFEWLGEAIREQKDGTRLILIKDSAVIMEVLQRPILRAADRMIDRQFGKDLHLFEIAGGESSVLRGYDCMNRKIALTEAMRIQYIPEWTEKNLLRRNCIVPPSIEITVNTVPPQSIKVTAATFDPKDPLVQIAIQILAETEMPQANGAKISDRIANLRK